MGDPVFTLLNLYQTQSVLDMQGSMNMIRTAYIDLDMCGSMNIITAIKRKRLVSTSHHKNDQYWQHPAYSGYHSAAYIQTGQTLKQPKAKMTSAGEHTETQGIH